MKFSIKKMTCLLLLSLFFSAYGGSYFSSKAKGLGLRVYSSGVRGFGMGGTGLASLDSLLVNSYAVSQWRYLKQTRASIDFFYQRNSLEIGDESASNSLGNFSGINVAIPMEQKKWILGMSLQPYTRVDFKNRETRESNGTEFTQFNLLTGGISKAQLNLVWSPAPEVGLSLNGNYYFGSIQDRYEFRFTETNDTANFLPTSHTVRYRFKGPGLGLSMDVRPIERIALAGFVDFATSGVDVEGLYDSQTLIVGDEERNFDEFPLHFGIGTNIQLNDRWNIALDYSAQQWANTLTVEDEGFDDWSHFGIGFERKLLTKRNAGFWNSMDLRAGYSLKQLGYKFNGESTQQSAVHFGLGIPFTGRLNRLDIGLEVGVRGDQTKNLASERFVNLQVAASIGELWFNTFR